PEAFGAALQYFTGSKAHNVRLREMAARRGLKISEYGVFDEATGARVAGETEADVYAAVGLPWIPPELREDGGEIDAAREGRLPALVERAHLRGDLHDHTEWSDGHHPLERLVEAAQARGYEYVIVSDHSRSLTIAQGLSVERLRQQRAEIRAVQARHTIRILAGSECDILEDGRLDFPDEVLAELDVVVASVHSRFKQDRATMTARIVRALENPHVDILGHPTGRRLGSRQPSDVDVIALRRVALWLLLASKLTAGWGLGWDIRWHLLVGRDSFWIAPHVLTYASVTVTVIVSLGVIAVETWASRRGALGPGAINV